MVNSLHVAIDIGTSSIKAVVVNEYGDIIRVASEDIPIHITPDGAAEHDLEYIKRKTLECLATVIKGFENNVESISFSNYLHGLAALDREGRVIQNVMTHLDVRASKLQEIVERYGVELYRSTGCPPIFVYPITKVLWLRERPGWNNVKRLSFVKDYIIHSLIGQWLIDFGVASGTGFLDISNLRWSSKALTLVEIDESMLPELVEGAKVVDYINLSKLGMKSGKTALVLGTFDGAAQNLGLSIYGSHAALNLGSTAVIRILIREPILDRDKRMRFFTYYAADGYRAVGGASNNGMTFLEWLRKEILSTRSWNEVEEILRDIDTTDIIILPFIAGERFPFRSPFLRFTLFGGILTHNQRHIALASFEAIGFILKAIVEALSENGIRIEVLHSSGGGSALQRLIEIISNVLQLPIAIYDIKISRYITALGTIATALRGLNYVNDISKIVFGIVKNSLSRVVEPNKKFLDYYNIKYRRFLTLVEYVKTIYRDWQ